MKDKWLNDIQDRMSDFEIEEPDGLWDDIATRLAKEDKRSLKNIKSLVLLWAKRGVGVAAMLALVFGILFHIGIHEEFSGLQSDVFAEINRLETVAPENRNEPQQQEPTKSVLPINHLNTNAISEDFFAQAKDVVVDDVPSPVHEETQETLSDDRQILNDAMPNNVNAELGNEQSVWRDDSRNVPVVYIPKQKPAANMFSMSVHTSGGFNSSFSQISTDINATATVSDYADWKGSPMLGMLLFNQGKEIETEVKHRLPVRTGVSVAYSISDRLSAETGVTYTNLTSDLKYGSDNHYISGRQTLHYIGIPLNVRYRVINLKMFDIYASVGALAEKCVNGKIEREYFLDNQSRGTDMESVMVRALQWSATASAGLQFNASSVVGVYVEPGVSYYFDNGSSLKTIYKDKPFNFNLNIGLRFTFGK